MQLKKKGPIRAALATATCTLLGVTSIASAATNLDGWQLDGAFLLYTEANRITVVEPVINGKKDFGGDRFLNLRLMLDAVSGASPNGASPSDQPQTFTSPSGVMTYTVNEGDAPVHPHFKDTRLALSAAWDQPITRITKGNIGLNFSKENDFQSLGTGVGIAQDLFSRNTTLTLSISTEANTINPTGGIPTHMTNMIPPGQVASFEAQQSRDVQDGLIGLTQIISRHAIMQLNYSYGKTNGYQNDPYKLISIVDRTTGKPIRYVYENRPELRIRESLLWQGRYHFATNVAGLAYRYYWDDWGVVSNTVDITYQIMFGEKDFIEPHIRLYHQSATNFYRHSLVYESDASRYPEFASADYRLGDMDGITVGVKFNTDMFLKKDASIRLEYYRQSGNSHPADAIGVQKDMDMFPTIHAFIVQILVTY
ncbi:MAG: DUF3570 domain-containing protein [Nitrospinota bacterium]|nr:DUF3570 domain-containing protein [Nitrospinota bacterium]